MAILSERQIDQYQRDGFLVVADFVSHEQCTSLRQRAMELIDAFKPSTSPSIFTTDEQHRRGDQEFFDSANGTWCFFESEAFDANSQLVHDKSASINKIGHAMHDLDPVFEAFSYNPDLASIATDIGLSNALALQSMYICKQPRIGGEVGCHQDAAFLYTDPITVTGFWFAIEDATLDNGCLWAAPGGHRSPLRQLYKRADGDDVGAHFQVLDPTPLPTPTELVPLEVSAGTLVVLHGLLPHWSDANRSANSRHAYSLHCIDASADYPEWNWLQRRDYLPLRRLDLTDRNAA